MKLVKTKLLLFLVCLSFSGGAQEKWTLRECIDYAKANNIQVKTEQVNTQMTAVDLESAQAARYPTLHFSTSQNVGFQNTPTYNDYNEPSDVVSYSGNYGFNSGVTLYAGSKLINTIKQQQLLNQAGAYDVAQQQMNIEIAVAQSYLQILYDNEALQLAGNSMGLSVDQLKRAEVLCAAGSLSKVDVAQLKSQVASDNARLVEAHNALSASKLALKQLLEFGITDSFDVEFPQVEETAVLRTVPDLSAVYDTALDLYPELRSYALNIEAAQFAVKIAKAAKLPTITANLGVSTSAFSGMGLMYASQLKDRLSENVGVTISVPIFNGKSARTSIKKAQLQNSSTLLQKSAVEKQLLSTVESLHNDVSSAQSRYVALTEQVAAARVSYESVREQFDAGLKNTVELTTEKNNYLTALSEQLQSKYSAVLAFQLLQVYQNQPIEL